MAGGSGSEPNTAQRTYLRERLLTPLSQALAELCHVRPADPLQYLADWLRHHRTMELNKGAVSPRIIAMHSGLHE